MNEQQTHRYKIWELGGNGQAARQKPPAREVHDLVALMALYDYRPLVQMELKGTCTLSGGGSMNLKTKSISPEAVTLLYAAQTKAAPGKRSDELRTGSAVHLDVDDIGAFRGVVAAKKPDGFQVTVDEDCKPMLQSKLARMAAEHAVSIDNGCAASSPHVARIEPNIKSCSFIDHTGTLRKGTIVNLSPADALIKARIVPPVRSRIIFRGSRRHSGEVTRTFQIGFTVKFCALIRPDEFSAGVSLSDQ